jgi:hypothetical protein
MADESSFYGAVEAGGTKFVCAIILADTDRYIVAPALGAQAGILGAWVLAIGAARAA